MMWVGRYREADRSSLEEAGIASQPFFRAELSGDRLITQGEHAFYFSTSTLDRDALSTGWLWDGESLTVRGDRLGFLPLFYATSSRSVLVSPSLPKLVALGASTEFDERSLAAFFQLGFFLGEDTPFRSIRVLPPAGVLHWRSGAVQLSGGIRLEREAEIPRKAALDGYIALFQQAIRRTQPQKGKVALPLSGGRDSRHILLELNRQGHLPSVCVTLEHPPGAWPHRPLEDAVVASRLAGRVGAKHVVLPPSSDRLVSEVRKNILTSFSADEHGWLLPLKSFLRGSGCRIYDGIGGDVLSAGLFLTEERIQLLERERIRQLADEFCSDGYFSTLTRHRRRFGKELALERIEQELRRHLDAPNPIGSFYFWNRTRREIAQAPFGLFLEEAEISVPYLDPDLHSFLASLPTRLLAEKTFHSEAISLAYPKFADIPYHASGRLAHTDAPRRLRRFALQLLLYLISGSREMVRAPALTARTVRSLLDRRYAPAVGAFGPPAVYLLQLGRSVELLAPEGAGPSPDGRRLGYERDVDWGLQLTGHRSSLPPVPDRR